MMVAAWSDPQIAVLLEQLSRQVAKHVPGGIGDLPMQAQRAHQLALQAQQIETESEIEEVSNLDLESHLCQSEPIPETKPAMASTMVTGYGSRFVR